MPTYASNNFLAVGEIATYPIDYTNDIPAGGTVVSASAVHHPPSGAAGTIQCTVVNPYVYATIPGLSVNGVHYIDITAVISDTDTPVVRIAINCVFKETQARPGMLDIISRLRTMTDAGESDYTIAGERYWSDAQLQDILDDYREDINYFEMVPDLSRTAGGTIVYKTYRSGKEFWEGGTANFQVQDSLGNILTDYTANYMKGIVTFTSDTAGSARFVTGSIFDLSAAAASIWRMKAGQTSKLYSFSTDGHSMSRSDWFKNCVQMADYYDGLAQSTQILLDRSDT